jgi:hypothetical protein
MKIDLIISGECATEHCPQQYSLKVEGVNAPAFAPLAVGTFAAQGCKLLFKEGWRAIEKGETDSLSKWVCPACLLRQSEAAQRKRFQIHPEKN